MNRRTIVLAAAAALAAGVGSYAACSLEVGSGTDELGGALDPDLGDDALFVPELAADAGAPLDLDDDPSMNPPSMADREEPCAGAPCLAGQTCCPVDGQCYPATCEDCCPAADDQPPPRVAAPDPESVDTGGLAGPQPPPDPVVASPAPSGGPPGVDPGPMPPRP